MGNTDREWCWNGHKTCKQSNNGTGLNGHPVNTAGEGPNTASESDGGLTDDRKYSTEVIYSSSDQDSDSGGVK